MRKDNNLDSYKNAYQADFEFHDENQLILDWYSKKIAAAIKKKKHFKSFLSLGIGHQVVSKSIIDQLSPSHRYTIIEGSPEIIERYKNEVAVPENVTILNTYFEDFALQEKFDVIEMGFVLEHVDDPSLIIKRFAQMLHADGLLFAAVPNACSLHRLIGYHAGILESTHELSPADLALGHKHYFDKESFCNLITQIGLKIKKIEGIYLKPFSTSQLQTLNLSPEVQQALLTIGSTFPDICNSIYIEAGL